MAFERELEVALDAARRAGEYLLCEYERFVVIPDAPADISTDADRKRKRSSCKRFAPLFQTTPCAPRKRRLRWQAPSTSARACGSSIRSTVRAASRARMANSP